MLKPLRLDTLEIEFPIVQAALSGYSDRPMRLLAMRLGAGATIAEVMLDQFVLDVSRGGKARLYLGVEAEDHPVGAQIMGADPVHFARAATRLVELGFDFIDLNFACPVPKVVGRCRGGALLTRPEIALEIVSRVREAVPPRVPVTVKMRRGMDASSESRDHFFTILDGALERGVAAVTLHARYVRQRYEGASDWDFLREVKQHMGDRPLLGSGDLFSAEDCMAMLRHTGVDGLAVARGAIGNPWIFRDARALVTGDSLPPAPRVLEQREVIRHHYRMAEGLYGERRASALLRKFGIRYAWLHPQAEAVRGAFIRASCRDDWENVLNTYYTVDCDGQRPPRSAHAGLAVS